LLVDHLDDSVLTVQVKCPGGRSDKALRLDESRLGARAADAGLNRLTRHAIALTQDDYALPF
jgi:hypothetical protein